MQRVRRIPADCLADTGERAYSTSVFIQDRMLYRTDALSLHSVIQSSRFTVDIHAYPGILDRCYRHQNWAQYAATSAFSTNRLSLCRCCCLPPPTATNHVTLYIYQREKIHLHESFAERYSVLQINSIDFIVAFAITVSKVNSYQAELLKATQAYDNVKRATSPGRCSLMFADACRRFAYFTESLTTYLVFLSFVSRPRGPIIFVVSVGLFVCLSVCLFVCTEFFSAVFDPISIKLGHMLYVWVQLCLLEYRDCATPGGWVIPKTCIFTGFWPQKLSRPTVLIGLS